MIEPEMLIILMGLLCTESMAMQIFNTPTCQKVPPFTDLDGLLFMAMIAVSAFLVL
jgi:hypothetical protein